MTILDLPTELVECICSYLDLSSFQAFRLTSTFATLSNHHFCNRFFRRKTLSWTEDGLFHFRDMCHQEQLRDAIQHLVIDATPRYEMQVWKATKDGSDDVDDLAHNARSWMNQCEETRFDHKILTSFFKAKGSLQSVTFAYDGMEKRYAVYERRYCGASQNEMSRPFITTMAAIALSNAVVYEILIQRDRNHGAISVGRLETLSPHLRLFEQPFRQLQVLQINLRDWRENIEGFALKSDKAPFVIRFLSLCTNLRSLQLSCWSSFSEDLFASLADTSRFTRLERCKLEMFRIYSLDSLFDFLIRCKESLRHLELNHIVLRDCDWSEVMQRIASELDVESVALSNMFTRIGARVGLEHTLEGSVVLDGPSLSAALRHHAEHLAAGHWGPASYLAPVTYPFIGMRT